jgi:2-polyprenyl-3-methyl-5-hydroxy-6-metoxy-1,4-benzoquinol methylase
MNLHDVLALPCEIVATSTYPDGTVAEGTLRLPGRDVPVRRGVPRFCGNEYADNFSLQWNRFRRTQLDSHSGLPLTARRLWASSGLSPEDLRGKKVLEAGSGAGRFTEVLLGTGCELVSCDLSGAVDANWEENRPKGRFILLQSDIFDLPLRHEHFDLVLCYGVLQHTPRPREAFLALWKHVRPGGSITIDYYGKHDRPTPFLTQKYLWRPLTTRLKPETLLKIVEWYVPKWLPIDRFIRNIPRLGGLLAALVPVPCCSYPSLPLSPRQHVEWAILDTFDGLGAAYDFPKSLDEVREMVTVPDAVEVSVVHGYNGLVANLRKAP